MATASPAAEARNCLRVIFGVMDVLLYPAESTSVANRAGRSFFHCGGDCFNRFLQLEKLVADNTPDDTVGKSRIIMAQHVSDARNLLPRNFRPLALCHIRNTATGFRNDFDATLHQPAHFPT